MFDFNLRNLVSPMLSFCPSATDTRYISLNMTPCSMRDVPGPTLNPLKAFTDKETRWKTCFPPGPVLEAHCLLRRIFPCVEAYVERNVGKSKLYFAMLSQTNGRRQISNALFLDLPLPPAVRIFLQEAALLLNPVTYGTCTALLLTNDLNDSRSKRHDT